MQEAPLEEQEEIKPRSEEANFEHPSFKFIPNGHHEWRQQGFYLICKSCSLEHAIWIGKNYLIVGIKEDGKPQLKTRKELGFL